MNETKRPLESKLDELQELFEDLNVELRFYGCDTQHRLVQHADEMIKWLRQNKAK
ncbi:hypothetical protein MD588_23260 [Photobacterium sp. SDRW27]|uniref:hypothetical protein n=1 Tax=Photobacterium obscurum TaxID=2829490 RepID=UPI002244A644|nr:hypothetical protein [Photobacterium obscurum]MCW8331723.1 hypothetical protein [Photobacterium obscurum]